MPRVDHSSKAIQCARFSAALTVLMTCVALVGWQFGIESFKSLVVGLATINPVTAATFGLAGGVIFCLTLEGRRAQIVTNVLATLVLAVGIAKLGVIFQYWQSDFDTWLFHDKVVLQFWNGSPSRVAPMTALCFALWGGAVLLRFTWPQRGALPTQLLLVIQALLALAALLSYFYGARSLNDFGGYLPMALPTALLFLALPFGTICALPNCGVMQLLINRGEAGLATQRLLLAGMVTPLLLGWITLQGQEAGYYSPVVSVAIFCVLATLCFAALVLWNGFMLLQMQTSRLLGEEELRESEERFRLLSNSAFEALAVAVDGVIIDVNQEFCRIFRYEYEEVIGKRSVDFVTSSSKPLVANKVSNYSEDIYLAEGLRKDGSSFDIEIWGRIIPLRGQKARVTAVRDVTERRRVERMKDEFVSVVNHELRTPLTSIHGALGLMANGMAGPLSPASQLMTDVALRNAQRLLTLINDLLDIQKIEAGQMSFTAIDLDLGSLIRANIEAISAFAANLNVSFECDLGPVPVSLRSDPDRLAQVLMNLFSNAAKFSPPHGVVRVKMMALDDMVRVEVHDDGGGIPDEFKPRIFEKFAQADSSATRSAGGTGLGLSICKSIMEHLGGSIGFQSNEKGGTTFNIEMPLSAAKKPLVAQVEGVEE
jgi:PAS domain S-box-containing protein